MKVERLVPAVETKIRFSWEDHKFAPAEGGCYAIVSFTDEVLYVGLATSISGRMGSHLDDKGKLRLTAHGVGFWFHFRLEDDESERARIERGWLALSVTEDGVLPSFNKVSSPL